MSKVKKIGFEIKYPIGCKEVHSDLKDDELKKRLRDLMNNLESISEDNTTGYDSLLCETRIEDSVSTDQKSFDFQGLLLHLSSEQFVHHHDRDVQLQVAICLCYIIKISGSQNPFLYFTDSEHITQVILHFFLECIKLFSQLKSKGEKLFLPVYTILSICCEIDIFRFYTCISDSEKMLAKCFHVFFDVIRRSTDWGGDAMLSKIITDALVNLLSFPEASVSEALVTYLLNLTVDPCSSKIQKEVVIDIFSKCINKLEDQIQTVLQNYLITNEKEEEQSESSDNNDSVNEDDDFCSLDSHKIKLKKSEKIKSKSNSNKAEPNKNTLEPNLEYGCHHVFQMIYEMFKISETIVIPLLPTIEMKLRSTQVTDRKRACRLLGKLFSSSAINDNPCYGSLWDTFLGRFSDIELDVREICVKVARNLLKSALDMPDKCGVMIFVKEKTELIKTFQKRCYDQEESIRYLIVDAASQILLQSKSIVQCVEMDSISDAMFKLLIRQSQDKFLSVRKDAHTTMAKLYVRIIGDCEMRTNESGDIDLSLGLKNLRPTQKSRMELLLKFILRPYQSTEVEDRIVVERLFNTHLVPYGKDSAHRMRSLLQCLTLCDEQSVLCIHEMFKTQVSVMNIVRQTMDLIGDTSKDNVISPILSQKLREKVKNLSEYLSNKDKIDSLTKMFNLARTDKRLNDLLRKFVNKDSGRTLIVKTIRDIKSLLDTQTSKSAGDNTAAALLKKKAFINTVKCILERGAPIMFDGESVQELLSHCVSAREAMESSSMIELGDCVNVDIVPLSRTLRLLHTMLIMSKRLVPLTETFEYLVSVMSTIDQGLMMTTTSTSVEDLCLAVFVKMLKCRTSDNSDHDEGAAITASAVTPTLFTNATASSNIVIQTNRLLTLLSRCCITGSCVSPDTSTVTVSHSGGNEPRVGSGGSQDITTVTGTGGGVSQSRDVSKWKYDCKVAKLSSQCLVALLQWCQIEHKHCNNDTLTSLIDNIQTTISNIVKQCCDSARYSSQQPTMLTSLTHISVLLNGEYESIVRTYATDVIPKLLEDSNTTNNNEQGNNNTAAVNNSNGHTKNLVLWQPEASVSINSQVKIQALKLLSRWIVTLRADLVTDQKCIVYVMSSLRKYIGNYGTEAYSGDVRDTEMSHLRLAAGKCWLRVAQVQSFLPIFDVKWIYRLSSLIHDPCPQVRDEFLRKLNTGLYKLKLPLEYMAMFVFVSKVKSQEYLNTAKRYLQRNITRRRDFLDSYPEYMSDAKKLFGVLPEYVLSFVIHMLAHDPDWKNVDDDESLSDVKQCLWFVMEPILKINENYSFIRKLLERIKHAQDASEPSNATLNEKLYICSDIALGLLISKQSSYGLKEYPVELKLPRTRYVPAPNTFFNPDFANILLDNCTRARIQFSPTPKSRQTIKNFLPALLIKGHQASHDTTKTDHVNDDKDISADTNQHIKTNISKPKKHTAKIVMGVPEMESEVGSGHSVAVSVRKPTASKRKISRSESPQSEQDEMSASQTSVTQRGRICKPNILVMKDMVSPTKKGVIDGTRKRPTSPKKKRGVSAMKTVVAASPKKRVGKGRNKSIPDVRATDDDVDTSVTEVRLEGMVSVNIERLISDVVKQTLSGQEAVKDSDGRKASTSHKRKSSPIAKEQRVTAKGKKAALSPNKVAHTSPNKNRKITSRKSKEVVRSPPATSADLGNKSPQPLLKRLTRGSVEDSEQSATRESSDVVVRKTSRSKQVMAPPLLSKDAQPVKNVPHVKKTKPAARLSAIIADLVINSPSARTDSSTNSSPNKASRTRTSDTKSSSVNAVTAKSSHSKQKSTRGSDSLTERVTRHDTPPVTSDSAQIPPLNTRNNRRSLVNTSPTQTEQRTTRRHSSNTDTAMPKPSPQKQIVPDHSDTPPIPRSSSVKVTKRAQEPIPIVKAQRAVLARKVSTVKSPLQVIVRSSKRMASVFATEELLKKSKLL